MFITIKKATNVTVDNRELHVKIWAGITAVAFE